MLSAQRDAVTLNLLQQRQAISVQDICTHCDCSPSTARRDLKSRGCSGVPTAVLGTRLGTLVKSEGQANGRAWMLGMVLALIGCCWYPAELFPQFMRSAAKILPTTWAMEGMLNIVLRGQGLAGVLLGMAALFFAIGVRRFRFE